MSALIFSILSSSAIFVLFKLFPRFGVNTLQAIVINYGFSVCMGLLLIPNKENLKGFKAEPWFWWGLALGVLFISLFYLMAYTSQKVGISVTSVATKMSLAIPVVFFSLTENEQPGTLAWTGVGLALVGVYLASVKESNHKLRLDSLLFPAIIFVGSGIIDSSLGYAEKHVLSTDFEIALFACLPFASAFSIGSIFVVKNMLQQKIGIHSRTLVAGIVLGVINYFSIFYLIKAFGTEGMARSSVIPVNNIGVVTLSALAAFILFKEHLSLKNKMGLLICLISLLLLLL